MFDHRDHMVPGLITVARGAHNDVCLACRLSTVSEHEVVKHGLDLYIYSSSPEMCTALSHKRAQSNRQET